MFVCYCILTDVFVLVILSVFARRVLNHIVLLGSKRPSCCTQMIYDYRYLCLSGEHPLMLPSVRHDSISKLGPSESVCRQRGDRTA